MPNYIDPLLVFTPNLPAQGNLQSESVFTWTPTATASGKSFVLNFLAQDDTGMGTNSSVLIKVNSEAAPVFVKLTPNENSIRQIVPGAVFSDVISAQSTIGSLTSIVYAKYPSGATLSKTIPTQSFFPSEVVVDWVSTPANFGPNVFEFQVAISNDPTIFASRKYTVIVNTPSFFESTPLITALVGQKYSYTVNINDIDIVNGDQIKLDGLIIPSWLTLVKQSEKIYVLEGTPTLNDIGLNAVSLQSEDIYHHDPSSDHVFQKFDINVKTPQTIAFGPLADKICSDIPFELTATSSSGLQVIYTSSDPSIVKTEGTLVTILKLGIVVITATQTGNNNYGSASEVVQSLTVIDNQLPVITSSGDKNITTDLNVCGASVVISTSVTDNCTVGLPSGIRSDALPLSSVYPVGTTTIKWNVSDANSNAAVEVIQTIIVMDNQLPVITSNGDKKVTTDLNVCGASVVVSASATDNCTVGAPRAVRSDALSLDAVYPVGITTITWKTSDSNGNDAVAVIQTVTVIDAQNPTIATLSAMNVNADAAVCTYASSQLTAPTATDNCSVTSVVASPASLVSGTNTVTWTVTDGSGLIATSTQTVTVVDAQKPTVITKNIPVSLDAFGNASIAVAQINNGSTDNCGIASLTLDKTSFTCATLGANTVTLTATDVNGNVSSQTAVVTIEDKVAPVVVTKNKTIQLNATGAASIVVADVNNGSTDNCGISLVELDKMAFTCANVGANTVTLKVTDNNGNVATQTAIITVEDKIAPVVITKNITVQLDASSNILISAADVNNGSTDNCGIRSLELDKALFSCADIGENVVTLKVTDNSGNVATKTAIVTVVNTRPNIIRKHFDDVIFFDNSSKAFVAYSWYKNGVLVPGQTAQYFKDSGVLNGTYYAKATKIDGTVVTTCPLTFSASIVDEYLKIAPNPVKSNASYQILTNVDSAKLQNARITVFNILGVLVHDKMVDGKTTDMIAPNTEGIYVVRMTLANGKYFTKNLLVKN